LRTGADSFKRLLGGRRAALSLKDQTTRRQESRWPRGSGIDQKIGLANPERSACYTLWWSGGAYPAELRLRLEERRRRKPPRRSEQGCL